MIKSLDYNEANEERDKASVRKQLLDTWRMKERKELKDDSRISSPEEVGGFMTNSWKEDEVLWGR